MLTRKKIKKTHYLVYGTVPYKERWIGWRTACGEIFEAKFFGSNRFWDVTCRACMKTRKFKINHGLTGDVIKEDS